MDVGDAAATVKVLASWRSHKYLQDERDAMAAMVLAFIREQDRRIRALEYGVQRLLLQAAEEIGRAAVD